MSDVVVGGWCTVPFCVHMTQAPVSHSHCHTVTVAAVAVSGVQALRGATHDRLAGWGAQECQHGDVSWTRCADERVSADGLPRCGLYGGCVV